MSGLVLSGRAGHVVMAGLVFPVATWIYTWIYLKKELYTWIYYEYGEMRNEYGGLLILHLLSLLNLFLTVLNLFLNIASIILFYGYCFRLHDFSVVNIPRYYKDAYVNSFFLIQLDSRILCPQHAFL